MTGTKPALLSLKITNVANQRVDFWFRQFLAEAGHLLFSVHNCIEQSLIGRPVLPYRIGQISRVVEFGLYRFCAAILPMT